MAQTQPQQYSSQPFSPPVSSPSPGAGSPVNGGIPPPKRPRLSPLPQQNQSPYASPNFATMQLPPNPSPSMNGTPINGTTPPTPAPPPPPGQAPPPGVMGPPSRPVDKATDAAELTDVLASSGIDVREEEAFLTSSYSAPGVQVQQPPRPQQPPPINTSFGSQISSGGTVSTATSFTDPSLIKPQPSQDSFYREPAAQPHVPFKDPNQPTREDTEAARRAQYHLQEPFLFAKVLEQRLQRRGFELGVRIPAEGLFHPVPGRPQPIEVTGPDGSSIVRTGQTILNQEGAPLVDILNLLSISCEERLRSVIDYSSTLSRTRRTHSHGLVPVEWTDLAAASSGAAAAGGDPAYTTPLKRPRSAMESSSAKSLSARCRMLIEQDQLAEEMRTAKRTKRNTSAILGESTGSRPDTMDIPPSTPSTPMGEKAPVIDKKGMTKKEAKKLMDARASEAQQHQQSVETARMATNSMLSGRMFGSKKTYSWLNPRPPGGSSSGFSTPSRAQTATPVPGTDKPAAKGGDSSTMAVKKLGVWREDREKGSGIQVRDILFMLELDGRGSRHVQKAYSKDVKEDRLD
ncbi:hypothetical protein ASPZODRAFT_143670 [Penicilliopsis zonata CBS 506.65]|uniref:Transcription initiation factor TFIID subunit 4 n=1 Tax=Penicilliopsis zonata CBS 506.65 TaxID=1073090 RepID=A0A1L9SF44_9EURO|nr:hypothetical protein ASPZODRAFT_143670 [Penicilliopsis zonata CBS 506.65]OJJ45789.1 hypothetical protein ASPZODRAFT_143670 [Penicilliopsis zonata CBS 506.65]